MTRLADPDLPERRRRQILDAARACFHARGFRHATIEDICAEARVSPGALYRYFGSKADIVVAIAGDAHGVVDAQEGENDLLDALELLARRAVNQAELNVELWAEAARDPVLAAALAARNNAAQHKLTAMIASQAPNVAAPNDVARALLTALDGEALRYLLNCSESEMIDRFLTLARALLGLEAAMERDDRHVESKAGD